MIKRCLTSLVVTLIVCFLAYSSASARVCFLPDSTDCGGSDVDIPCVPCKYSTCPAYNSKYQECYDERTCENAGVIVTCKQIRCKLSKSECEEQAKATSHSCKFDDASGCYYLGECKQCNRDIYDSETDLSGEGYTCTSCTGCDGTFYNCTPIEKECSQIDSTFSTSCGDSQIAKEAYKNGVLAKDSHGNQCYTCEDQPVDNEQTCAEKGYKTCAECSADQICELNGQQGSDGPCAKGCRNQDVAICSSDISVSEKYDYLKKLIDGLAINADAFSHLGNLRDFDLYETMKKANLVQSGWIPHVAEKDGKTYIDDKKGNLLSVFMRNVVIDDQVIPRVHLDIYLDKTFENLEKHQVMPIDDCMDVYKNLMKPLYCKVDYVGVYSTNYISDWLSASYGDKTCGDGKTCLQNISDSSIRLACNSCTNDNKQCYMPIIFRQEDK